MRTLSLVIGLIILSCSGSQAEPVVLHFTVPAPCSQGWANQGGAAKGSKAFGQACLRKVANHPKMDRQSVFNAALQAVQANDQLSSLTPSDIKVFCPNYAKFRRSKRQIFWATLLTAIARPESNYDPMDVLWEGDDDPEYSIGLLQISPSNKIGYQCTFKSEARLTDPAENLDCGVRIMTKLVRRDQMLGGGDAATGRKGSAAYWSTMRAVAYKPGRAAGRLAADTRNEIIGATMAIPGCQ